jgi:hypothetical protein
MKFFLMVLLLFTVSFSGSFVILSNDNGVVTYGIKPLCKPAALDTVGPLSIADGEYVSINYLGKKLSGRDTAIVDSGFQLMIKGSNTTSKLDISNFSTADSLIRFFGSDSVKTRGINKYKNLSLDLPKNLWLVFKRWDTNTDTLDCKNSLGKRDSTIFTVNLKKNR